MVFCNTHNISSILGSLSWQAVCI